jgi:hypothetical protein
MLRHEHEQDRTIGTRRSRRAGLLLLAAGAIALAALMVWIAPGGGGGRERADGLVRTTTGSEGSVGTAGQRSGEGSNSGPALSTIHELETITGSNDGHELVGRRVDLHVPVSQHINDVAFWVGAKDNRLLVVLGRDNRGGDKRQHGGPATSGVDRVPAGQQATVSGTIQRVPYAEAMYSWGLTNADRSELMDRPIYLRADRVTSNGESATAGATGTAGSAGSASSEVAEATDSHGATK